MGSPVAEQIKTSPFLRAYDEFVRASDKQRTAFWGWEQKVAFKKEALEQAQQASPAECELFLWYVKYRTAKRMGKLTGELTAQHSKKREAQGEMLLIGISLIWRYAKSRQGGDMGMEMDRNGRNLNGAPQKAAESLPEAGGGAAEPTAPKVRVSKQNGEVTFGDVVITGTLDENGFMLYPADAPLPAEVAVNSNGNGSKSATVPAATGVALTSGSTTVYPVDHVLDAYERAARDLMFVPSDSALASVLGCDVTRLEKARAKLTTKGYEFALHHDGSYRVVVRPFDRNAVIAAIVDKLHKATDAELISFAELIEAGV